MMLLKILLALTITTAVVIVTLAWLDFTANATRILQGDLPESKEYGDGGL